MTAVLNHQHLDVTAIDLSPVKRGYAFVAGAFQRWSTIRERARRDAEYWVLAQTDHRVMAELRRAMCSPDVEPR
jgi:hypothetical protein